MLAGVDMQATRRSRLWHHAAENDEAMLLCPDKVAGPRPAGQALHQLTERETRQGGDWGYLSPTHMKHVQLLGMVPTLA